MSRYPSAANSAAFLMAASAVSRRSMTRPHMSVAEIKNDIGGPDRRSLTGRQLKPVTKTDGERRGRKTRVTRKRKRQSRSRAGQDQQRSRRESPLKQIHHAWYSPFHSAPARMEGLCRCTVKEFCLLRSVSSRVDVLMQHPAVGMGRRVDGGSSGRDRRMRVTHDAVMVSGGFVLSPCHAWLAW